MQSNECQYILVGSFIPSDTSDRHGPIHKDLYRIKSHTEVPCL